jgi:hypothetical protein
MVFGVPGLRKLALSLCLIAMGVTWLSCSGGSSTQNPSKIPFRAFISNSLHPVTTGVHIPAIEIMDAGTDKLSFSPIPFLDLSDMGPLSLSSNKRLTLVYSPGGHTFKLVDNSTEQAIQGTMTIPDATESFFLATNTLHIYAAVPNAPVPGGVPGALVQLNVATSSVSATIPIPHVQFIQEVNRGQQILAFGDNCLTIVTTGAIGTTTDPRTQTFCGLDEPVGAGVTADASHPFVLLCGQECGGTGDAAIVPLDLSTNTLGTPIPMPGGATVARGVGSTLYVAGSAPATVCSSGTAAISCGTLTTIDTTGAKAPISVEIPNGYHTKIEVADDGQVIVGSRDCEEINTSTEVRGCMAIYNPTSGKVVVPPHNGDVTGIAPIPGRDVFYAVQGGTFLVYDTTKDELLANHQTRIVGEVVDVKVVDNAP